MPPYRWDTGIELFCEEDKNDTLVASPKSCRHYFECATGIEGVCPDGQTFNEEKQRCDSDNGIDCVLCPRTGHLTIADPRSCNYFYHCVEGLRVKVACPDGLRFDDQMTNCVPRAQMHCSVQDICRYQTSLGGIFLVADPNDCRK